MLKGSTKPGGYAASDRQKRERAFKILAGLDQGKTKVQIAKELGVHKETVHNTLNWAENANIFVEYEQKMWAELVPLAHDAIKMALEDGDAQVALKIYDKTIAPTQKNKAAMEDEEGLYGEIQRLRAGRTIDVTPGIIAADDQMDVVSGTGQEPGIDWIPPTSPDEGEIRQQALVATTATGPQQLRLFD